MSPSRTADDDAATIPRALRTTLRRELDAATLAVTSPSTDVDDADAAAARARLEDARTALGLGEHDVELRLAASIRALLRQRRTGRTICPSEAARAAGGADWRASMPATMEIAWSLAASGWLEVTQGGEVVRPPVRGPVRLRRRHPP